MAKKPQLNIKINGIDKNLSDRISKMTISEVHDAAADQVTIVISDHDNNIQLPKRGVKMTVLLGYEGEELHDKGDFIIDQISYSIAPDIISITGCSADFLGNLKEEQSKSWHKKTLKEILETISTKHDLTVKMSPEFNQIEYDHKDQKDQSDTAFVKSLAKDLGAVLMIKSGYLIFMNKSEGKKISGELMPTIRINKNQCATLFFNIIDREATFTGVSCLYLDSSEGKQITVLAGNKKNLKKISKIYKKKGNAQARADSEFRAMMNMGNGKIDLSLGFGDASITPETNIILDGFIDEISKQQWIVTEVKHSYNNKGIGSRLSLESRNNG